MGKANRKHVFFLIFSAGIEWTKDALPDLVQKIAASEVMTFHGLYGFEGHSYHHQGEEVSGVADETAERILQVASMWG